MFKGPELLYVVIFLKVNFYHTESIVIKSETYKKFDIQLD